MTSLRDEWLADPAPLPYVEWLRRRSVPAGLLTLQTPEVNRQEQEKVERKPAAARKRKSRANPNGRPLVHGTAQGRKRHIDYGEEVCAECAAGYEVEKVRRAADKRAARAAAGAKPRQPPKCGTPYMARKHRERGEDCKKCKKSVRDEWRNRQKVA